MKILGSTNLVSLTTTRPNPFLQQADNEVPGAQKMAQNFKSIFKFHSYAKIQKANSCRILQ